MSTFGGWGHNTLNNGDGSNSNKASSGGGDFLLGAQNGHQHATSVIITLVNGFGAMQTFTSQAAANQFMLNNRGWTQQS